MLKKYFPGSLTIILLFALALVFAGCRSGNEANDSALIDDLLDRFQYALADKNIDLMASLCTFPLYWDGTTFDNAGDFKNFWQNLVTEQIEDYELCIFYNRIIKINGNSATIDAYSRTVFKPKGGTTVDNWLPHKITMIKVNGSWRISRIEPSSEIDIYLVNNLLNQYQTAMKNRDIYTLVSLCTFPFDDEGTQYNDAIEMTKAYQTKFAQTSYAAYEIKDRNIGITDMTNGMAVASIYVRKKPLVGDWIEVTEPYQIDLKKVNEVWKVSALKRLPQQ